MKKFVVLAAIVLLLPALGAAAEKDMQGHAPDSELVSLASDNGQGDGQSAYYKTDDQILDKAFAVVIKKSGVRETKTAGQPSFDDLEMERGVKIGDKVSKVASGHGDEVSDSAGYRDDPHEDLLVIAQGHGEEVKEVVQRAAGQSIPGTAVRETANGHGDTVSTEVRYRSDGRDRGTRRGRSEKTGVRNNGGGHYNHASEMIRGAKKADMVIVTDDDGASASAQELVDAIQEDDTADYSPPELDASAVEAVTIVYDEFKRTK